MKKINVPRFPLFVRNNFSIIKIGTQLQKLKFVLHGLTLMRKYKENNKISVGNFVQLNASEEK